MCDEILKQNHHCSLNPTLNFTKSLVLNTVLKLATVTTTSSSAVAKRSRDALCLSLASIVQYVERNLLLLVTLALDLSLRKLNSVLFSSVWRVFTDAWLSVP